MKDIISKSFEMIDRVDYVSFDVFDTLIKRNLRRPVSLFKYIEKCYNKKTRKNIKDFHHYRIQAERIARTDNKAREVSIDDIYLVLAKIYKSYDVVLRDMEIEAEINICIANEDVRKIYEYAIKKNKKILIISDFYLNKNIVKNILKKNGYENYYEIFVSCDYGITKNSGNLFKYVLNKYKISSNNIIHIGDNKYADNKIPNRLGIKSIKIFNEHYSLLFRIKTKLYKKEIDDEIIEYYKRNDCNYDIEDKYERFGYEKLGILFYGFLKYINQIAKKNQVEHIYFFSRDGYILHKAYDENFADNDITSSYFYISRRAVIVPSLINDYGFDELIKILGIRSKDTLYTFFKRIGLDINRYIELLSKYKLSNDDKIYDNMTNVIEMYKSIKPDIIDNAQKELNILKDYLIQEGMNRYSKALIVDIGWRGSMQYSLESILKKLDFNIEIIGAYLGLNKESKFFIKDGMKAYGFLFSEKNNYEKETEISAGVGLIESLFLAPHGSVINYYRSKKVEPVFDSYEYSDIDKNLIGRIQNGALNFINKFRAFERNMNLDINSYRAFERMEYFIKQPNKNYIKILGDIGFSDYENIKLAKPKHIGSYFINPKQLKNDFLLSQWKVCFLKRLFKIKLPYFTIYKYLRKVFS